MHAAKGLEWPIVVPVNTMTAIMAPESAVTDRDSDIFYCPVFGVKPSGYDDARDAEKAELDRERIRLWYVAATRARELLVLPRLDVAPIEIGLDLASRPVARPICRRSTSRHLPADLGHGACRGQTPDARDLRRRSRSDRRPPAPLTLARAQPRRKQRRDRAAGRERRKSGDGCRRRSRWRAACPSVQGGRERGLILHKLIEEVLTGETPDTTPA